MIGWWGTLFSSKEFNDFVRHDEYIRAHGDQPLKGKLLSRHTQAVIGSKRDQRRNGVARIGRRSSFLGSEMS